MLACYNTGIELAPERAHGIGGQDRRTFIEQGGVYPDDVKVVTRVVPIPYNMSMDLSIFVSNTDQLHQILEQIMIIFEGYSLQIQFNDRFFDWTRLTTVELVGFGNEENIDIGTERRAIKYTLQFMMPVWLTPPADVRTEIIQQINIRLGDLNQFSLDEIDDAGNLSPFINEWGHVQVNSSVTVDPSAPSAIGPQPPDHYDASLDDCRC